MEPEKRLGGEAFHGLSQKAALTQLDLLSALSPNRMIFYLKISE